MLKAIDYYQQACELGGEVWFSGNAWYFIRKYGIGIGTK